MKETEPESNVGQTWLVDTLPCPSCGNYTVIGYLLTDENGRHQHTYYTCTFWRSGLNPMHKRCEWSGWFVPGWNDND